MHGKTSCKLTVEHHAVLWGRKLMNFSTDSQQNNLKSLNQNLVQTVIQAYTRHKESGHGEMAARNAAIVTLREACPNWNFRAASDMVSQIIDAIPEPLAQSA